jgi:ferredoxin
MYLMPDEAQVKEGVEFNNYEEGIIEAADSCPVEIIKYEEY